MAQPQVGSKKLTPSEMFPSFLDNASAEKDMERYVLRCIYRDDIDETLVRLDEILREGASPEGASRNKNLILQMLKSDILPPEELVRAVGQHLPSFEPFFAQMDSKFFRAAEMNGRINEAFLKEFGLGVREISLEPPYYFVGGPGEGKTSIARSACKSVAKRLGYEYVEGVDNGIDPSKEKFRFGKINIGSTQSVMDLHGMPARREYEDENGEKRVVTERVLPDVVSRMVNDSSTAAGFLFIDEFNNAAPNVQNAALDVLGEHRLGTLNLRAASIAVGAAGNTGHDGTFVSVPIEKMSKAGRTRVQVVLIEDDAHAWSRRYENDKDVSDSIKSFVSYKAKDLFGGNKPQGYESINSRTLEYVGRQVSNIERLAAANKGNAYYGTLDYMRRTIARLVDNTPAGAIASFCYAMRIGAVPMAEKWLAGEATEKDVKEKLGVGLSVEESDFSRQFADALVNIAGNRLIETFKSQAEDKAGAADFEVAAKGAYSGLMQVHASSASFALERMRVMIYKQIDGSEGDRLDFIKQFAVAISKIEGISADQIDMAADILSNSAIYNPVGAGLSY